MSAATTRRRRIAAALACGLAAGSFALGAALGDSDGPAPSAASQLSPSQLAGQRVLSGFEGGELPGSVRRLIREGRLAGVILFADNLPSRAAGRRLVRSIQAVPRPAGLRADLLVMADQEGGLVKRLAGAPSASAREMGERGPAFSRRQGRLTAANLRDAGVNVDLAPVLDVARGGGTIAATDRGFGSTPDAVAATAVAFAEGLRDGGVAATAKHFPGLGAAGENTDFAVERIDLSEATLRGVDEVPYRPFIEAGGDLVMLSTAIYPAFSARPAAFSHTIATGELRRRLGFAGVSVTDALDSVAVKAFGGPRRAALAASRAGADLLLYADPRSAGSAQLALLRAIRRGSIDRAELEPGVGRVLRLRGRLG